MKNRCKFCGADRKGDTGEGDLYHCGSLHFRRQWYQPVTCKLLAQSESRARKLWETMGTNDRQLINRAYKKHADHFRKGEQ